MDVINPEVLRVTPAYRAFERCAQALRVGKDGDLYFKSEKSDKVSTFWSHSWRGGHRGKIMTLMTFYNEAPAVILGSLVAVLMMFLFGFADLPAWYRIESNGVGYARWSLCSGFLATSMAMLFWRPQDRVFLDKICIHEKDLTLKTQAIFSLAGLLKKSDLMLILWDPTWTERMWCLFELAAFLKSRKAQTTKQELIIRPVLLGPVSIAMFITSSVVMFPLTFLGGAVSGGIMTYAPLVSLIFLGGLVTIYMFVGTLRSYFQDLETMKQAVEGDLFWSRSVHLLRAGPCEWIREFLSLWPAVGAEMYKCVVWQPRSFRGNSTFGGSGHREQGSDSRSFHRQVGSWSHGSNPMELHGHGGLPHCFCTKIMAFSSLEFFIEWFDHLADSPCSHRLRSHCLQYYSWCAPQSLLGHEEFCDHTICNSLVSWNSRILPSNDLLSVSC